MSFRLITHIVPWKRYLQRANHHSRPQDIILTHIFQLDGIFIKFDSRSYTITLLQLKYEVLPQVRAARENILGFSRLLCGIFEILGTACTFLLVIRAYSLLNKSKMYLQHWIKYPKPGREQLLTLKLDAAKAIANCSIMIIDLSWMSQKRSLPSIYHFARASSGNWLSLRGLALDARFCYIHIY